MSTNRASALWQRLRPIAAYYVSRIPSIPRLTLDGMMRRLPSRTRSTIVNSLERSARHLEMDLDTLHPASASHRVSSTVVAPAAHVVIPASGPYDHDEGHHWNPLRVHRLRDVVVDPSTGLVFAGDRVISQSAYGWRNASDGAFLSTASTRARRTKDHTELAGPLAPFGGAVFNYYHFLIETLPRILHIKNVEPNAKVVLTGPLAAHIPAILGELGIEYVLVPRGSFFADDVLLCDAAPHPWPHPGNIRILNEVPVHGTKDESDYPAKLYVSRAGGVRQVPDAHLLDDYLQEFGYVPVRLETLPWAEQVAHLRSARSVVALHGAGLANTAFMRPGGRVVEMTTGITWFPSMRNVARLAGVDHELLLLPYDSRYPQGTAVACIEALSGLDL